MSQKRDYNDEYKKARRAVIKRDKNKCQMPGCDGKCRKKQVHHISRWADMPGARYDVSNLILLCVNCHREITGKEVIYSGIFRSIILNKLKGKK